MLGTICKEAIARISDPYESVKMALLRALECMQESKVEEEIHCKMHFVL